MWSIQICPPPKKKKSSENPTCTVARTVRASLLACCCLKAEVRSSFITTTVWEQCPRSHHKGATGRVRTGNQRYPVLCHCQLNLTQHGAPSGSTNVHWPEPMARLTLCSAESVLAGAAYSLSRIPSRGFDAAPSRPGGPHRARVRDASQP